MRDPSRCPQLSYIHIHESPVKVPLAVIKMKLVHIAKSSGIDLFNLLPMNRLYLLKEFSVISPALCFQLPEVPAAQEEVETTEVAVTTTEDEVSVKEEPPSPASSISSRVSETGSKSSGRKSLKGGFSICDFVQA